MLSRLKNILRDQLGLPPWIVLAAVGLVAHVVLNLVLRKPMTSGWGLLGPLALGVVLESCEIWIQYREIGLFAPGNDPMLAILARHGFDIAVMLAVPVLVVVAGIISAK